MCDDEPTLKQLCAQRMQEFHELFKVGDAKTNNVIKDNCTMWKDLIKENCIVHTNKFGQDELQHDIIKERFVQVEQQYQALTVQIQEYESKIATANALIPEKQREIAKWTSQLVGATAILNGEKQTLKELGGLVLPQKVKKLHQLLDKKRPVHLAKMCESLIALLRCKNTVSASDVEQYLANFDGLLYKMQNIDPAMVPESSVNSNE